MALHKPNTMETATYEGHPFTVSPIASQNYDVPLLQASIWHVLPSARYEFQ